MGKNIKLQIRNRWTGDVSFEYECEDNTLAKTVKEAARQHISLCDADLCDANLRDADLRDADLCDADLCDADLCDADLCDANLRDADLRDANLCDADLRDANLRGANLCGADLRDANLRGANLCDADLCDANLRGADLRDANLRDADLCGSVIDYNDNEDGYGSTDELIRKINENSNIRPTAIYENHDTFSSRWGAWWRNLIIIREWEVKSENKQNLKSVLTDGEKNLVGMFAKFHGVSKLTYSYCRYQDEFYGYFTAKDDELGRDLELDRVIPKLEDEKEYSLEELGIKL